MTATVAEHWEDDWLRANWDTNANTIECAYGAGFITLRQYLDATHDAFLEDLDGKLTQHVAETLTIDEALTVLACR